MHIHNRINQLCDICDSKKIKAQIASVKLAKERKKGERQWSCLELQDPVEVVPQRERERERDRGPILTRNNTCSAPEIDR